MPACPRLAAVLLGPSGSGKTTLLRCLAGIERVTAGQITIGATLMASDRVHIPPDRRNLSMVFQDYALWPHLPVRENVAFALRRLRLSKADAQARTLAMLERVFPAADASTAEVSANAEPHPDAPSMIQGAGLVGLDRI